MGLALEPWKEERSCIHWAEGAERRGFPPHFSVCAAAFSEVLSASSGLERCRHLEVDSCLVSIDCQPASPQGLWGMGQKDVLPAFFLKEGIVGEWISDSLPVVLASGKESRAVVSP